MFRSRNRHVFRPTAYGSRRRRRIPRWLVLLVSGIILGAGGLLFLQKSYGPTRLTLEQSEQLQFDLNSANIDKQRLETELGRKERELAEVQTELDQTESQLARVEGRLATIDEDLQVLADAIPADPRGTSPGVRAANFVNRDGKLDYTILIMQDKDKMDEPFKGNIDYIISGQYSNGAQANVDIERSDLELEQFIQLKGSFDLPDHYTAHQVTIRIRATGSDKVVATRTLIAKR